MAEKKNKKMKKYSKIIDKPENEVKEFNRLFVKDLNKLKFVNFKAIGDNIISVETDDKQIIEFLESKGLKKRLT